MHVFDAKGAAIGFSEGGDQVLKSSLGHAQKVAGLECPVQIRLAQTEFVQLQQGNGVRRIAKRIEPCQEVAQGAIGIDQSNHAGWIGVLFGRAMAKARPKLEPFKEQPP